jgi:hypothetical protein
VTGDTHRAAVSFDTRLPLRYNAPTWCAQVAQMVEQRTENPRVRGSIPRLGTTSQSTRSPRTRGDFFIVAEVMANVGCRIRPPNHPLMQTLKCSVLVRPRAAEVPSFALFDARPSTLAGSQGQTMLKVAPPGKRALKAGNSRTRGTEPPAAEAPLLTLSDARLLLVGSPHLANNVRGGSSRAARSESGIASNAGTMKLSGILIAARTHGETP